MDPHKVGGDISANIFRNVCETLLTYDENWEISPLLAESYEQVSDTEWVFHLKEGVTFSNGEPFDAEAAIWNFKRAASDKHPRQALSLIHILLAATSGALFPATACFLSLEVSCR